MSAFVLHVSVLCCFCWVCFGILGFQICATKLLHEKKTSSGIWSRERSESQVMFYSEQRNWVRDGESGNTQKLGWQRGARCESKRQSWFGFLGCVCVCVCHLLPVHRTDYVRFSQVTITSVFHDSIFCWMNQKWMISEDGSWEPAPFWMYM